MKRAITTEGLGPRRSQVVCVAIILWLFDKLAYKFVCQYAQVKHNKTEGQEGANSSFFLWVPLAGQCSPAQYLNVPVCGPSTRSFMFVLFSFTFTHFMWHSCSTGKKKKKSVIVGIFFFPLCALQTPPTQPSSGRRRAGEAANPTIGRPDSETPRESEREISGVHEADC